MLHVSLRQLSYFVAAARHGSTLQAALALHVSQPSISHAIATLEAHWGEKLFHRIHAQGLELTTAGARRSALAQALLATLPPQDRKNLEYGELEFFHTNEYKMGFGMVIAPSKTLKKRGHTLRVKTTLGGEVNIYEIDTKAGTVEKQNFWIRRYTPPYTDKNLQRVDGDLISKTLLFKPFKDEQPDLAKAQSELAVMAAQIAALRKFRQKK